MKNVWIQKQESMRGEVLGVISRVSYFWVVMGWRREDPEHVKDISKPWIFREERESAKKILISNFTFYLLI